MQSETYTTRDLRRRRGWTAVLIRQFAAVPDHLAVNPHHPGGPAMRLYLRERIEAIEQTEEFQTARAIAEKRQQAAAKALKTKSSNAAASAAGSIPPPVLPAAPRDELVALAVQWHNSLETWRNGSGRWISAEDPDAVLFPIVRRFIFDRLTEYRTRARPVGLPLDIAIAAVDQKINEEIGRVFPWLDLAGENHGNVQLAQRLESDERRATAQG